MAVDYQNFIKNNRYTHKTFLMNKVNRGFELGKSKFDSSFKFKESGGVMTEDQMKIEL